MITSIEELVGLTDPPSKSQPKSKAKINSRGYQTHRSESASYRAQNGEVRIVVPANPFKILDRTQRCVCNHAHFHFPECYTHAQRTTRYAS